MADSAGKSTCAVRSALPGSASGSAGRPSRSACRLSPESCPLGAVVDDQRRAPVAGEARCKSRRQGARRLAHFHHVALGLFRRSAGQIHEPAVPHPALRPAVRRAPELPDRQRIQELVRQQQQRAGRQRLDPIVPNGPRQALGLHRAQPRRGLDQMQPQRAGKIRDSLRGSRAARRPSACRAQGRLRPGSRRSGAPIDCQTTAAHRPSSSPNTWLISGEVVKSANGSRVRVVRRVGAGEEGVEPLQGQADTVSAAGVAQAGRRCARTTSTSPAISMGSDSSWPIVAPANRKPRNASGSRKNSLTMRAMA